jgi:putative PIN family toxin of toxin-antitoxin system
MRLVLDANVLIAAVAGRGLCESLLELCLEEHEVVVSAGLLEEVHRKLVAKIRVPDAFAVAFCDMLRANATEGTPSAVPADACRDPADLYLLGLALSMRAAFLITGDKDLLDLSRYGATTIVTPRLFWDHCRRL